MDKIIHITRSESVEPSADGKETLRVVRFYAEGACIGSMVLGAIVHEPEETPKEVSETSEAPKTRRTRKTA